MAHNYHLSASHLPGKLTQALKDYHHLVVLDRWLCIVGWYHI
jgi:hypothetical protein